ncbi:chitinase [Cryobacterium sp. MLB-32]|uniref:chitinase n=1 Tax=Cryobacterium sp. MLB-32 TaxID=1529318 RepID=UPI00056D319A|nr:chitinase [Cryobacterium sp. MLB-32]
MSQRFPGRRLSVVRVAAVACVAALVVGGGIFGLNQIEDARAASTGDSFFAGYVDVTATPEYSFESSTTDDGQSAMLSFIVADADDSCSPSWGTFFKPGESGQGRDLDRRIARFAEGGGEVAISFGGLLNDELATVCTSPSELKKAYASVVTQYPVATIDLDIEGSGLSNRAAGERRATAIAAVQQDRAAAGKPLAVWLTLPVSPTGLTEAGTTAVRQMLSADVDLAGVNLMVMDYGTGRDATQTMYETAVAAAEATHVQLESVYASLGQDVGTRAIWRTMGLTPMIGQNDEPGEVFTLRDATLLNAYAQDNGLGRMSAWSANRDRTCGGNYPDVTRVSDSCSGVEQGDRRFAEVLARGFSNRLAPVPSTPAPVPTLVADNPVTSPYPIWSNTQSYVANERIVLHGHVYSAKWFTTGDQPDNPLVTTADAPWKLIGPVLPGDRPAAVLAVPAGTYDDWSAAIVYQQGQRVLLGNRAFEAKWWTQGDSPQASLDGSDSSPWMLVSDADVQKILDAPQ